MAIVRLTHAFKFLAFKFIQIDSIIHQIGPGIVVLQLKTFFGDIKIIQTLTPIEALSQRLSHYFYGSPFLGFYMKFAIWGETVNVGRDVMIWDSKSFVRNPMLAKEEKPIKMYRNWFGQFYSENSKTFASTYNNDLEW
jgi:cholesterol 7-dehydrogenase